MTHFSPKVRLAAVRARNYLAFGGSRALSLEIRPLTLIFGRNSSGKTALLRLVRLVLRAIARPMPDERDTGRDPLPGARHLPLRLDDVVLASNFIDTVHGRFAKEVRVGLDLEIDGGLAGYDVDLLPADTVGDRSWMVRFAGHSRDEAVNLELDLAATLARQRAVYHGAERPEFDGIAPRNQLRALRAGALTLDGAVSHLGPLRVRVPSVMTRRTHSKLGYDGAGAPDMIAADDDLAARVDAWYARNLDGCRLQVRPLVDAFELVTTTADGTAVNLAQAGEGLHQALPIVVQQQQHHEASPQGVILDLVEQPELHLHDAVHAPLADLFLDTARLGRGAVVVETHSEGILLRVRRRIAEGTFDPANLAIYFVDRDSNGSYVRSISVNRDGELSEWPQGVFLEGYHEILAIQRAIRSR